MQYLQQKERQNLQMESPRWSFFPYRKETVPVCCRTGNGKASILFLHLCSPVYDIFQARWICPLSDFILPVQNKKTVCVFSVHQHTYRKTKKGSYLFSRHDPGDLLKEKCDSSFIKTVSIKSGTAAIFHRTYYT